MGMRRGALIIGGVLVVGCGLVLARRGVAQQAVQKRFEQLDGNGAITTPEALEAVEAVRKGALKEVRPPSAAPPTTTATSE